MNLRIIARNVLLLPVAFAALAISPGHANAEPPAAKAGESLRGEWLPIDIGKLRLFPVVKWQVGDAKITAKEGPFEDSFSYKLDATVDPPAIDLTALDGQKKGKKFPGIWRRDGDFLEVCYDERPGAKRPRAFVTTSDLGGTRTLLFVRGTAAKPNEDVLAVRYAMKNLGQALHAYQQRIGQLPPAYLADMTGQPLSSWRVQILPFIEQRNAFKLFQANEPWSSAKNQIVTELIVKTIVWPINAPPYNRSPYRVFQGKGMLFEGSNPQKLPAEKALSTTILLAEAPRVVWTKPEELLIDDNRPLPPLGGSVKGGFHVLLADGSVRLIKEGFNEKVFRQLLLRDKRKQVKWEDLCAKGKD